MTSLTQQPTEKSLRLQSRIRSAFVHSSYGTKDIDGQLMTVMDIARHCCEDPLDVAKELQHLVSIQHVLVVDPAAHPICFMLGDMWRTANVDRLIASFKRPVEFSEKSMPLNLNSTAQMIGDEWPLSYLHLKHHEALHHSIYQEIIRDSMFKSSDVPFAEAISRNNETLDNRIKEYKTRFTVTTPYGDNMGEKMDDFLFALAASIGPAPKPLQLPRIGNVSWKTQPSAASDRSFCFTEHPTLPNIDPSTDKTPPPFDSIHPFIFSDNPYIGNIDPNTNAPTTSETLALPSPVQEDKFVVKADSLDGDNVMNKTRKQFRGY